MTMENTGFKGLLVTLYQRVILSYRSTLIGILVACAPFVIDYVTAQSNPVLHAIGLVLGSVFALVKEQLPKPPPLSITPPQP
jgi:hypothetical protein